MTWQAETLPGCWGYPCEALRVGAHVARVWRSSAISAGGAWCWHLDGGQANVVWGNRGSAKTAAACALRRAQP